MRLWRPPKVTTTTCRPALICHRLRHICQSGNTANPRCCAMHHPHAPPHLQTSHSMHLITSLTASHPAIHQPHLNITTNQKLQRGEVESRRARHLPCLEARTQLQSPTGTSYRTSSRPPPLSRRPPHSAHHGSPRFQIFRRLHRPHRSATRPLPSGKSLLRLRKLVTLTTRAALMASRTTP